MREWLAADADGRDIHDHSLGQGIDCDPSGCVGKLSDGALVAAALEPEAFAEDCQRAVLVIAARDPPPGCAAMLVTRELWRSGGALALRRTAAGFAIEATRPKYFDRPWAPAPKLRNARPETAANAGIDTVTQPRAPRDATPRQEDIEADQ
jgi:competence protein ComEC